jgi:hypothetical protein
MRPTQKAAVALIAGAIIHAAGGIVGQVVQASTAVSDDMFSYLAIVFTPLMPLGVTVTGLLQAAIGAGRLTRPTPVTARAQPAAATPSIALS